MKIKQSESAILKQIMNYLKLIENLGKGWFVRTNSGSFPIVRANGTKGWMKTGRKGSPDIVGLFAGHFIAIEVKSLKGKQSLEQQKTMENITKLGGCYMIAHSTNDVIKAGLK